MTTREFLAYKLWDYRYILAIGIIAFSIMDVLTTQWALTHGAVELNPIMAPIVTTPWLFWVIRIGVPMLIVKRHLRKRAYGPMFAGCMLFGTVIAWNTMQIAGIL